MSRTLEASLVFPLAFVLLLAFAGLAFLPYPGLRVEVERELRSMRGPSAAQVYYFTRAEDGRPELESCGELLLGLLSAAADNWSLLRSAYAAGESPPVASGHAP